MHVEFLLRKSLVSRRSLIFDADDADTGRYEGSWLALVPVVDAE
jgi:hypothetical protein